jgi:hypothetical protein
MKMTLRQFLPLSAAFAIAFLPALVRADIDGIVYNIPGNMNDAGLNQFSGGTELGTFGAPSINFAIFDPQSSTTPLSTFLSSGGAYDLSAGLTSSAYYGEVMSNCTNGQTTQDGLTCYSTAVEVTGTATFVDGTTYNISHDDGVVMYVDGVSSSVPVIDSGSPTSDETSSWTPTSTITSNFEVWYVATNGNPEVLQSNIVTTPEPGAAALLVTMLMAVAGFAGGILKKRLA